MDHAIYLWGMESGLRGNWQLDLDRLFTKNDEAWLLEEPAGWFLNSFQAVVGRAGQTLADDAPILVRGEKFLKELVEKYADREVGELGFSATDNFDKKTTDGAKRLLKVEQLQGMLEALIEYLSLHRGFEDESQALLILKLFQTHNDLSQTVSGGLAKLKKGRPGKDDKKDKAKDAKEQDDMEMQPGDRTDEAFRPPTCCLSLKCADLALKALLSGETRLGVENKFVLWLLGRVQGVVEQTAGEVAAGDEGEQHDTVHRHLARIAGTLFIWTVGTRQQATQEYELSASDLLLSTLDVVMSLFSETKRKLFVVSALTGRKEDTLNNGLTCAITQLKSKIVFLLGRLDDPDETEIAEKLTNLAKILKLLVSHVKIEENEAENPKSIRNSFTEIMTAIEDIEENESSTRVIQSVIGVYLPELAKFHENNYVTISSKLASQFHKLCGEFDASMQVKTIRNAETYSWLTNTNKEDLLPIFLEHLNRMFDDAETALGWVKSLALFPQKRQVLTTSERSLNVMLGSQVNAMAELSVSALAPGPAMDGLLKLLIRLYSFVALQAKYYWLKGKNSRNAFSSSKFDLLVENLDKKLTKNVQRMLDAIWKLRKEREEQAAAVRVAKKKVNNPNLAKAKVMKDSKHIPQLILKNETMNKELLKLGKLVGKSLIMHKLSNRDFKIKADNLVEVEAESGSEGEDSDDSAANSSR